MKVVRVAFFIERLAMCYPLFGQRALVLDDDGNVSK